MTLARFCFIISLFILPLTAFSQGSLKTITAEKGDGVYSLLRKQGLDPSKYYQAFLDLNASILRNGTELLEGRSYQLPVSPASTKEKAPEVKTVVDKAAATSPQISGTTPGQGTTLELGSGNQYPIFGPGNELVKPVSTRLQGAVYYLISGHGGPDPGAVEQHDGKMIAEDEYAYDVTLRLAKQLLAQGAMVYIIVRDSNDGIREERDLVVDNDEVVFPNEAIPRDQLKRLQQRVDAVNKLYLKNRGKYQRLIVTHVDSRSEGKNIDVFFYHHEKSVNGKRLAECIHETFNKNYRKYQPYRDYAGTFSDRSNLYMVKNTLPAMAYIEIGNIRNKRDQRRILDPDNRQALAKWIGEGILLDYETRK
jgi:N-acetylmuramoyl-L-alanine amidase